MAGPACAMCGQGPLHAVKGTYETEFLDRDGEVQKLLVPDVTWNECENCREVFLDDAATRLIEAARRKALGLLSPDEIRAFRLELDKTQKEMSRLLGIGEKTYCRWESGAYMQSTAFDRYLRLVMRIPATVQVLEELEIGETEGIPQNFSSDVFAHLGDVESLQHAASIFTGLLETGRLYQEAEAA